MPDTSDVDRAFAAALAAARVERSMTRTELAAQMKLRGFDLHPTAVTKIEGDRRRVTVGEAAALADILGIPVSEYLSASANRDRRVEVERAAWHYANALKSIQDLAADVADYRSRLAEAVAAWEREGGEPYQGEQTAADVFRPLLDLGTPTTPVDVDFGDSIQLIERIHVDGDRRG